MKKTLNEITELLEAELAEAILQLHDMELKAETQKMYIRRLLNLIEQLRE